MQLNKFLARFPFLKCLENLAPHLLVKHTLLVMLENVCKHSMCCSWVFQARVSEALLKAIASDASKQTNKYNGIGRMVGKLDIIGILQQKNFYRPTLIFWIVMGCGKALLIGGASRQPAHETSRQPAMIRAGCLEVPENKLWDQNFQF